MASTRVRERSSAGSEALQERDAHAENCKEREAHAENMNHARRYARHVKKTVKRREGACNSESLNFVCFLKFHFSLKAVKCFEIVCLLLFGAAFNSKQDYIIIVGFDMISLKSYDMIWKREKA